MPESYENHLYNLYSGLNVGPKILRLVNRDEHHQHFGKFEDFIPGYRPYNSQLATPKIYRQVAEKLANIHDVRARAEYLRARFTYANFCRKNKSFF